MGKDSESEIRWENETLWITLTFSLCEILFPGPILCSLSIQYEGIPRSSAISCRCEVLLEFHPPTTNIRSTFSSTSLYIASWRSWKWNKISFKYTWKIRKPEILDINRFNINWLKATLLLANLRVSMFHNNVLV